MIVVSEEDGRRSVRALSRVSLPGDAERRERWLQECIFDAASIVPVSEIDPVAAPLVPVCRELRLGTGLLDILCVSPHGKLTLIECKLWRNPEARREVVGQILDYAAQLRGRSYGDLTGLVKGRIGASGQNPLYDLVRARHPDTDEVAGFVDAVSRGLATGNFCLVILGDGIRGEVQAIDELLRPYAGLAFSFGVIQVDMFRDGDQTYLFPRLALKTRQLDRHIAPAGELLPLRAGTGATSAVTGDAAAARDRAFWQRFIDEFEPDNPEQAPPRHGGRNYVRLSLPSPLGTLVVYRARATHELGMFVRFSGAEQLAVYRALRAQAEDIQGETGLKIQWQDPDQSDVTSTGQLSVSKGFSGLDDPATEDEQLGWFAKTANTLLNALRPRIRRAAQDVEQ